MTSANHHHSRKQLIPDLDMLTHTTALLLIDVQKAWDDPFWGERNNPEAEKNIAQLLTLFRQADRPVIHIQHHAKEVNSPFFPDEPGVAFKKEGLPLPGEKVILNHHYSAFVGTDLEEHLRRREIDRLVVAGFSTNWCVSSTVRSAHDLGFKVVVIHDACATFSMEDHFGKLIPAEELHRAGLTELHGTFGIVLGFEDLHKTV